MAADAVLDDAVEVHGCDEGAVGGGVGGEGGGEGR